MSRSEVLEVALVGHRITHEDDLPPPRTVTAMITRAQSIKPHRSAVETAVSLGRKITIVSLGELEGSDPGEAPKPCGAIEKGSPNTLVGPQRQPVATADEEMVVPCQHHSDGPVLTGAASVFVNGRPIVRRTDELDCGAFVGEGEPTVLVGGPRTERTTRTHEGIFRDAASPGAGLGRVLTRPAPALGSILGRNITMAEVMHQAAAAPPSDPTSAPHLGRMLTDRHPAERLRRLLSTGQP